MSDLVYTAFFPFGGIGAGARGFLDAQLSLMGHTATFRSLGGIDLDAAACVDFEYLTGSPSLCADVNDLAPADVVAFAGAKAPDVIFMSPPCKGASGLLSQQKSETEKYRNMNKLALQWVRLMLGAWGAEPPRLVLLENVPRLKTRAAAMLREVRSLLHRAGYVCRDGFHDCGELGGLAQRRRRYLLVARHTGRVPPLLYQPVKKKVRACGDVLGPLPMPGDPEGGPMHRLPRISWLNWVRLALIPAGGDWRDLPGVLEGGQARRTKFKRHRVETWDGATGTVGGSGSNGVENVADPRPAEPWGGGRLGVLPFDQPAGAIAGESLPPNGRFAVADPRIVGLQKNENAHRNHYKIAEWDKPAGTVIGAGRPGSGGLSVNDPRARAWFNNVLGVIPWDQPAATVTGNGRPGAGAFSVADPRIKKAFDHGYAVLAWDESSPVVAGKSLPGQGAYSIADPRLSCTPRATAYGVIPWSEAAKTVTGHGQIDNGAFAIADPRLPDAPPLMVITDTRKPPPFAPVIIAEDGTWHRPLTTLELAVLQGIPAVWNGAPLKLTGSASSAWRERIGNAVPPPAGRAIAERMLCSLIQADTESFALMGGDTDVWVERVGDDDTLIEVAS